MRLKHLKINILTSLFLAFVIVACNNDKGYTPSDNLRKLTDVEVIEYLKNDKLLISGKNVTMRDSVGNEITLDDVKTQYHPNTHIADYYVNKSGTIKEVVFRPIEESDKRLIQQMREIKMKEENVQQ